MTHDLGDNVWLLGLLDNEALHTEALKMVKIRITGTAASTWLATRYDYTAAPNCREQASFNERCFTGTDPKHDMYPVSLSATGPGDHAFRSVCVLVSA